MRQPDREEFLKSVKDHQIEILKDDGIYRHIKCQKPETWDRGFEIITFPGGLLYTGDMGTYEFERVEDMFFFFRSGINKTGEISINSGYWEEKCKSESIFGGGIKKFDSDLFKENVKEYFETYYEDVESEEKEKVREEIQEQIFNYTEDSEWSLVSALNRFTTYSIETKFDFTDFWESSVNSKTYYFIWCLWAIVWTVQKYDEVKK